MLSALTSPVLHRIGDTFAELSLQDLSPPSPKIGRLVCALESPRETPLVDARPCTRWFDGKRAIRVVQ